mmetsp:Transcript_10651/g.15591  ORF Transcript_10651/g.15591 Transcript_10651/m.15591 type:complete len:558 (-) Transcript_10651:14-1687(-)
MYSTKRSTLGGTNSRMTSEFGTKTSRIKKTPYDKFSTKKSKTLVKEYKEETNWFNRKKTELDVSPEELAIEYMEEAKQLQEEGNIDDALSKILEAIDCGLVNEESFCLAGSLCYKANDYEEAITFMTDALTRNPMCSECYAVRGMCYYEMNDYENAITQLESFFKVESPTYDMLLMLAKSYVEVGNHEQAVRNFTRVIEEFPEQQDPNIYFWRGESYLELNDAANAQDDFEDVLEIQGDFLTPYLEEGFELEAAEAYADALDRYNLVLKVKPNYSDILYRAGLMYFMLAKIQSSEQVNQSLENPDGEVSPEDNQEDEEDPYHDEYKSSEHVYLAEQAVSMFTRCENSIGENPFEDESLREDLIFLTRGEVQQYLEESEKALVDYSMAVDMNPECRDGLFKRALLQIQLFQRHNEALNDFEIIVQKFAPIEQNEELIFMYLFLADHYFTVGDYPVSIQFYCDAYRCGAEIVDPEQFKSVLVSAAAVVVPKDIPSFSDSSSSVSLTAMCIEQFFVLIRKQFSPFSNKLQSLRSLWYPYSDAYQSALEAANDPKAKKKKK